MARISALYSAVSSALWVERETLEILRYRLVCQRLVLTAGSERWLATAAAEAQLALERVQAAEVMRAAEVHELVRALGLDPEISLGALATSAPQPWGLLLADHQSQLVALVGQVRGEARENQCLLSAAAVRHRGPGQPERSCRLALATCASIGQQSLLEFLR